MTANEPGQPSESPVEPWRRPGLWRSASGQGSVGTTAASRPLTTHPARSASGEQSHLHRTAVQSSYPRAKHTPAASLSSLGPNATPPHVPLPSPDPTPNRGRARAGTLPSRFGSTTSGLRTPHDEVVSAGRWHFPHTSPLAQNDPFAPPMFASVPDMMQAAPPPPAFEPFARLPQDRAQTDPALLPSSLSDADTSGLVKTLDYLGLSDAPAVEEPGAFAPTRERAATDAALLGPTRTSVAPGGPVRAPLLARPPSLSANTMRHRLSQLPLGAQDVFSEDQNRPRATSMGTLDRPSVDVGDVRRVPSPAVPIGRVPSPAAAASPARAPGHGRLRADTIAALSGPDGRQRTELELQRTAHGHREDDALGHLAQPLSRVAGGPRMRSMTIASGAAPRAADAERNLYLSQLSGQASTRVLLRLFEPYGVIDDILLFPEHHGAVIQFRDAQHARAAHDAGVAFIGPYLVELLSDQRQPPLFSRAEGDWSRQGAADSTPPHRARHGGTASIVPSSDKGGIPLPAEHVVALAPEQQRAFGDTLHFRTGSDPQVGSLETPETRTYHASIPPVNDGGRPSRRFDNARFRELRKNMESGQMSQAQADTVATEHLDVIVELSSNYIGNTVVQRFFEQCSEEVKTRMLERIAPHLATIGTHKNGTWAAQKIIDCAKTDEQQLLITRHLQPYVPALLLDQFGNYVVQCVLPFGFPRATFILDAMVDRCWEIAQGRFGARSMRTVLEHASVPRAQLKRVAMAVILNCVPLATSANGALLLTWLLETSGLEGAMGQLAPRFVPHLAQLCTHKLASVTILRIVCQSAEPGAATLLLRSIFDLPQASVLEEILLDLVHGSQLIAKALQSPVLSPDAYTECVDAVAAILLRHDLVGAPAYRRLAEQVGLALPDTARMSPTHLRVGKTEGPERPALMNPVDGIPPILPPSYGPTGGDGARFGVSTMPYAGPPFDIHGPDAAPRGALAPGAPPPR